MKSTLALALLFALLCIRCKSTQPVQEINTSVKEIIFGSGGGFTGVSSKKKLLINEKKLIWRDKVLNLKEETIVDLTTKFDLDSMLNIQFTKPGNLTYSITLTSGNKTNKITWGKHNSPPPLIVSELYSFLTAISHE
ncbi:hypothetical protein [Reichenbachiella versicolor]|uniref:hypothetical protein n=1 Tax=Reichenbachiella versicolor TaxID=1821036 RepID=UPI0013A57F64|nr:hypothetical protein [Reichenbachiella versicolor]